MRIYIEIEKLYKICKFKIRKFSLGKTLNYKLVLKNKKLIFKGGTIRMETDC